MKKAMAATSTIRTQPEPGWMRLPWNQNVLARALLNAAGCSAVLALVLVRMPFPVFMSISCGAIVCFLVSVLLLPRSPGSGLVKTYFAILVVFHFGLLPSYLLTFIGGSIPPVSRWINDEYFVVLAIRSCLIFTTFFVLAAHVAQRVRPVNFTRAVTYRANVRVYYLAVALLLLSIGAWSWLVLGVAKPQSYIDYYRFLDARGLGNIVGVLNTTIASAFFIACLNGRLHLPMFLFGAWGIFAFMLGLRAHVLFPLALTVPLVISQGRLRIHWVFMLFALLIVSSASAIVGQTRVGNQINDASPLAALAELGGSLRPSYEVEKWLHSGDHLRWGATYYAPVERTFLAFIPGGRSAGTEDERLMNVLIQRRAGPYGFSVIAEAVVNFGIGGAAMLGAVTGLLISFVAARITLNRGLVLNSALAFGMIVHVRQAFVAGFGAMMVFLLISTLIIVIDRVLGAGNR